MEQPTKTRAQAKEEKISLLGELYDTATELVVSTSTTARSLRKTLQMVENSLDSSLLDTTIELYGEIELLPEDLQQRFIDNRRNSRVRSMF